MEANIAFCLLFLTIYTVFASKDSDYKSHPCIRPCVKGAPPMTCEYDFSLKTYRVLTRACYHCPFNVTDCFRPHCVSTNGVKRSVTVANKMLPGPAIHVCVDDTIIVNVHNELDDGAGSFIHFHGLHQVDTPHMDGANIVTQCPIHARSSFQYKFLASPAGTHWWHSHTDTQLVDGLRGAAIVRKPLSLDDNADQFDHDLPEHAITISDWEKKIAIDFHNEELHDNGTPWPSYILINGKGVGQTYTNADNETFDTPRAEFHAKMGDRYRFRLINTGNICPLIFFIQNHSLTLIASEVGEVIPITFDYVSLDPGERYDVVVDANQDMGAYWVHVRGSHFSYPCSVLHQSAILRYDGYSGDPIGEDVESKMYSGKGFNLANEYESETNTPVHRLTATAPEDEVTSEHAKVHKYYVAVDLRFVENTNFHHPDFYSFTDPAVTSILETPQMNYITFVVPPSPPLTQLDEIPQDMFCNAETVTKDCKTEFCSCVHVVKFKLGEIVELIVVDEGVPYAAHHPMHLHGYAFRVMGTGKLGDSTSLAEVQQLDKEGKLTRRFDSTPLKDTVSLPDGGYAIVRFKADNPGMWFFHCHVGAHANVGMAMVIQIGEPEQFTRPPLNFPSCRSFVSRTDDQVHNCVKHHADNVPKKLRWLVKVIHPKYLHELMPCFE